MAFELPDPLATWLHHQLGQVVVACTAVGGGSIHRAWRLRLAGGGVVFAKTHGAAGLPLLEAEAQGLRALAAHAPEGLVIPEPLAWGVAGDQAALLLPWLSLTGGGSAAEGSWFQLGQGLAGLHRSSAACAQEQGYGWAVDNFIGSAPQRNGWRPDWGAFFAECRLAPQLAWAASRGAPLQGAQILLERVPEWLFEHHVQPVLVHGDLWSGNAGLLADGRTAMFDPACHWGDREVDLAMAQLFGGFPPAFFEGYARAFPLEPGAQGRVELYNLYHLLNHANLFGGGYVRRAQVCIDGLLA
ncbi:MAG: fructosamine kinase family protein [Cyanobium sp.]